MDDGTVAFEIDSCIRGYHAYGAIWTPAVGEHLSCEREMANTEDPYAVAVMRGSTEEGRAELPCLPSRTPSLTRRKSLRRS